LPRSGPILVVCAKGDTSTHVAEGLRRLDYRAFNLKGGMAAWGDHYEMRTVEETQRLTILQISRPARGCLSYLLASGGEAMVVDPARHIETYTRIATERGWRITGVFDTHLQADHLSGGVALASELGVDYWLHPYDSIHPEELLPATFSFRYLEDGWACSLGEVSVRVLHLPGHTLGMVNLLVDDRYLLSGDTLFIESVGRPDLGGQAGTWAPLLYRSLQTLLSLPEDTIVLPAHFSHMHEADKAGCYRATLGSLRRHHEGLRLLEQGLPAFVSYTLARLQEHPKSYDDIRRINTGLLQVDEARASELELGKNLCALSQRNAERRLAA
jgi:glyoxylase-like metal-dependent hydrolase (beta-lactamase superfamily II)